MAAERKLKVSFDEPERGWIAITMSVDGERLMLMPSHAPYDSIAELVRALNKILEGYSEAIVRWNEEPAEYEFALRGGEGTLILDVCEVITVQGGISRASVFNYIGTRDQRLTALWRALSELQGRYDPSEYERRWREPFPAREMEALTRRMKALKHG